jgi:hypothetical protein
VRLIVPPSIRAAYPNLPAEIRRSTKTGEKRTALARSRKICIDFFVKFGNREPR